MRVTTSKNPFRKYIYIKILFDKWLYLYKAVEVIDEIDDPFALARQSSGTRGASRTSEKQMKN